MKKRHEKERRVADVLSDVHRRGTREDRVAEMQELLEWADDAAERAFQKHAHLLDGPATKRRSKVTKAA